MDSSKIRLHAMLWPFKQCMKADWTPAMRAGYTHDLEHEVRRFTVSVPDGRALLVSTLQVGPERAAEMEGLWKAANGEDSPYPPEVPPPKAINIE